MKDWPMEWVWAGLMALAVMMMGGVAYAQELPSVDLSVIAVCVQSAVDSKAWPVLVWCAILLGIYGVKRFAPKVWERIPKAYRPLAVVGVGLLVSIGTSVVTGKPWLPSVVEYVLVSLGAIGGDQVQSKLRAPKD